MADLFIESALGHRSHTVILETHSEHLILRLLRRIRETSAGKPHRDLPVTPNDVAVYYISQQDGETKLTRIDIDMHGEFVQPWPDDFFELDFYERFGDAR